MRVGIDQKIFLLYWPALLIHLLYINNIQIIEKNAEKTATTPIQLTISPIGSVVKSPNPSHIWAGLAGDRASTKDSGQDQEDY